jgi:hypothetical protein
MDQLGISCKITSGAYLVRDGLVNLTEHDWQDQTPYYIQENENNGHGVFEMIPNYNEIEKLAIKKERKLRKLKRVVGL